MPKKNTPYTVRRTRTGLGLFATQPISKGKRIIEYTGPRIANDEVEKSNGKYFFGVNTRWSIDGSPRSNTARYINHSCKPNAEAIISGGRVWIWSRKKIRPGEEITYDYGKEYFDDIIKPIGCKCEKCLPKRKGVSSRSPAVSERRLHRESPAQVSVSG
jgi:SET domain-containing protein